MSQITRYPFFSHLRAEQSQHILRYTKGRLASSGRGLSFWFRPLLTTIASVPAEDLELSFMFQARSKDFQEVNVQGVVTYRVTDAQLLAERVDFCIDLNTGMHRQKPLERITGRVTELANQLASDYVAAGELRGLLQSGGEQIRARIEEGLRGDAGLAEMGIAVVSTRVTQVSPSAEIEKALRIPVRETIQQTADEATFRRRAEAVQKERAIQENELQNKIELAKQEENLISQKGANDRRRVTDEAATARIVAEGETSRAELRATSKASTLKTISDVRTQAERDRMVIYRDFPSEQLIALAVQKLAEKLGDIKEVSITPDHAGALLRQIGLGTGGTKPAVSAAPSGGH